MPGGTNVYRKQIAAHLQKRGFRIFLFSHKIDESEELEKSYCYDARCERKFLRHLSHRYFNPILYLRLKRWIREIAPDVIHIHHNYYFTNSVLLACKGKLPVLQTVHDHRMICPTGIGAYPGGEPCTYPFGWRCYHERCIPLNEYLVEFFPRRLERLLIKKIGVNLLVPSLDLKNKLERYGLRAHLLRHYVDLSRYPYKTSNPKGNRILFVGRLQEEKGLSVLIHAFEQVCKRVSDAKLDIVGCGPEEKKYQNMVRSCRLEKKVLFHGFSEEHQLPSYYKKANMVVLPSVCIENSPLVLLEAMAAGRPIIGTRIGGIPEMIMEGENGFLVRPGDPKGLTERLLYLLRHPERAEEMGRSGLERVKRHHSLDRHMDNLLAVFLKCRDRRCLEISKDHRMKRQSVLN
jgi:glycosyltransferase involved in cell wall biosynthesis